MDNTKLVVIALVAVLLIGGGAIALTNSGHDDENDPDDSWRNYQVPIFGNANNDTVIDDDDIDTIKKVSLGILESKDYPFADADRNGSVDDKDVEVVKKIIAGENTDVYFYDQDSDVVKISYPLKNICTINTDMTSLVAFFGGASKIAGYVSSPSKYPVTFKLVEDKVLLNTGRQLKDDGYVNAINLNTELKDEGGIGAWVVDRDNAFLDKYDDVVASGVPIIHIRCTDPTLSNQGALLLGTLMGGDVQETCHSYYKDCTKKLTELDALLDSVPDNKKKTFVAMTMVKYIAGDESQYDSFGRNAGGISVTDIKEDDSKKLETKEAITEYDTSANYLLNCATMDLVKVPAAKYFEHKNIGYLDKSVHFDDDTLVFINMSIPLPCRVVYAAAVMYPDVVSMEFADAFFQDIVDKYLPFLGADFDVTEDISTVIVYSDYAAEKAAA